MSIILVHWYPKAVVRPRAIARPLQYSQNSRTSQTTFTTPEMFVPENGVNICTISRDGRNIFSDEKRLKQRKVVVANAKSYGDKSAGAATAHQRFPLDFSSLQFQILVLDKA